MCLYGEGAARLHEELIHVTARWVDPAKRKGPLSPYGREAESNTLALLDAALLKAVQPANDVVLKQLRESAPKDVADLLTELETRGQHLADRAEEKLAERGAKEAKEMKAFLADGSLPDLCQVLLGLNEFVYVE